MSAITITIRDEEPPPTATVLLHFGNTTDRSARSKSANVIKYHDRWIGLLDDTGRFALSVYALIDIGKDRVLEQMPHGVYGTSTVGDVLNAGFTMMPTSIGPARFAPMAALQPFHYSILLPLAGLSTRLLDEGDESLAAVRGSILPEVQRLLELFNPTVGG